MLAINLTGSTAVVLWELGVWVSLMAPNYEIIHNCTTGNIYDFDDYRIIADPISSVPISLGT